MPFVHPCGFPELVDSLIRAVASANKDSRLPATALLQLGEGGKVQLEDWLQKPQRHEQLAVGDIASQYGAESRISYDHSDDGQGHAVPAGATGSLIKEKPDMDDCLEKLQGHEGLAVGGVASPVRTETKMIPGDGGEDLNRHVLAGLMDSTMNMESYHRLEDGTDVPAKHELLPLREYGSHTPAKIDEFSADIDQILSGNSE